MTECQHYLVNAPVNDSLQLVDVDVSGGVELLALVEGLAVIV